MGEVEKRREWKRVGGEQKKGVKRVKMVENGHIYGQKSCQAIRALG